MTKKIKGNKTSGDIAGRDIIKSYNQSEASPILALNKLSRKANKKLPKGVYNHYKKDFFKYDSQRLFESLIELSIPTEVALEIVEQVPSKIEIEPGNQIFSTRNIRKIVYSLLQKLDYSKFGKRVQIWGEHYIRKYGHSDIELQVILDEEHRYQSLDRSFIEKKLIPDLYYKCYSADITSDLNVLKSKSLLKIIANEILEKVRLLNLYHIRYSTLYKLSYDLAIQPPHHWFTDKTFRKKHISYNFDQLNKAFTNFLAREDIDYSAKEFIEHFCAVILSLYSLFIGLGKLRPLISLLNYLKLQDSNQMFWETIELSNLPADIEATDLRTSFHKLKHHLDKIHIEIQDIEGEYKTLLDRYTFLHELVHRLCDTQDELSQFNSSASDKNSLRLKALFLIKYLNNIRLFADDLIREEFKQNILPPNLERNILLGYLFLNNQEIEILLPKKEYHHSNSLLLISNIKVSAGKLQQILLKEKISNDFVFSVSIKELHEIVTSTNRCLKFEAFLAKNELV